MCFFKVKHSVGHIWGMAGLTDEKQKESASVEYWISYATLNFDIDLEFSRSIFKVVPCQEFVV